MKNNKTVTLPWQEWIDLNQCIESKTKKIDDILKSKVILETKFLGINNLISTSYYGIKDNYYFEDRKFNIYGNKEDIDFDLVNKLKELDEINKHFKKENDKLTFENHRLKNKNLSLKQRFKILFGI